MNNVLKLLGLVLVLCGVVCLVIYATSTPSNVLLMTSLILELVGIITFILLNKKGA